MAQMAKSTCNMLFKPHFFNSKIICLLYIGTVIAMPEQLGFCFNGGKVFSLLSDQIWAPFKFYIAINSKMHVFIKKLEKTD
jgi:hypothetical protein